MNLRTLVWIFLIPVLLVGSIAAWGDANPDRGRRLFLLCGACHSTDDQRQGKVGPPLKGIVGARAGASAGFPYSPGMRSSTIVWTPEALDAWLLRPSTLVPNTSMAYVGMPAAADRADVIAYLQAISAK